MPFGSPSSGRLVMPASSRIRIALKRSFKLCRAFMGRPSSSSLPSIMSGLLVNVVVELAVFRLGDTTGGNTLVRSLEEFLDSQEKAPASFRVGGGAEAAAGTLLAGGVPGDVGAAGAVAGGVSRFLGEVWPCGPGDQGIAGKEPVMLLSEMVFLGGSGGSGSLGLILTASCSVSCPVSQASFLDERRLVSEPLTSSDGSSSWRLTSSSWPLDWTDNLCCATVTSSWSGPDIVSTSSNSSWASPAGSGADAFSGSATTTVAGSVGESC